MSVSQHFVLTFVYWQSWLCFSCIPSNHDKNLLFTGEVIKAWDIAVATMKVGEICQITCKPEYAYGLAGSPPKIPPNATLIFEVSEIQSLKLYNWRANKEHDISLWKLCDIIYFWMGMLDEYLWSFYFL